MSQYGFFVHCYKLKGFIIPFLVLYYCGSLFVLLTQNFNIFMKYIDIIFVYVEYSCFYKNMETFIIYFGMQVQIFPTYLKLSPLSYSMV